MKKELVYTYIVKTVIPDEYCTEYCTDPTHAIIEITLPLIKRIRKLYRAAKKLNVYRIQEFDYTPEYKVFNPDGNDEENATEKDLVEWTEGSMDCNLLSVTDYDFYWDGMIKHSSFSVETQTIALKELWEIEKIMKTKATDLPLLIGRLESEGAKEWFQKRLKENEKKI